MYVHKWFYTQGSFMWFFSVAFCQVSLEPSFYKNQIKIVLSYDQFLL